MQEKAYSELTQNLKKQEEAPMLLDAEYRRLLPTAFYEVGENLTPTQYIRMAIIIRHKTGKKEFLETIIGKLMQEISAPQGVSAASKGGM